MMTSTPNVKKDRKEHNWSRGCRRIKTASSTQIKIKKLYGDNNNTIYSAVYQHETITRILLHLSFEYSLLTLKTLRVDKMPNLSTDRKIAIFSNSFNVYRKNYEILLEVEQEISNSFGNALDGEMLNLDEIIQHLREKGLQEKVIENFISRVSYYL